jgi:hypothetical protein
MEFLASVSPLEWILRSGVFGCFVGHGSLALMGNPKWLAYMHTAGFYNDSLNTVIMALIGLLDITVGIISLLHPIPLVNAWCFVWAFSTALMRPLSGEPIYDFVERAGNWTPSLALLYIQTHARSANDHTEFLFWLQVIGMLFAGQFIIVVFNRVTGIFGKPKKS